MHGEISLAELDPVSEFCVTLEVRWSILLSLECLKHQEVLQ